MLKLPFQPSASRWLARIRRLGRQVHAYDESRLREYSIQLRYRALGGASRGELLPEAYALVCAATERTLGMRHYDVQVLGGIHLAERKIIEMETGQGKTLTATLPLYLYALFGEGVHLATSNDYLAQRDAEMMRPLFESLAMTCGVVTDGMSDDQRRDAYCCDITYGSSTEFGFDFLRDRMRRRAQVEEAASESRYATVQRGLYFALADEADALLIDEANMPLVIGADSDIPARQQATYEWAATLAPEAIEGQHYTYDVREKRVELSREGRQWTRGRLQQTFLDCGSILALYNKLERAISVHRDFHRDQQYIVRDGEIVLINETTGRLGEGRQWQDGIHQAIQAVENLPITAPTTHAAKLTIQSLFLSYKHLAGMTGTAVAAEAEIRKVYKAGVVSIPPHHRSLRKILPTKYVKSAPDRWQAICDEVRELHAIGRPVLIGTRSVEKSLELSHALQQAGLRHAVLNAHEHAAEAEIIASAGQPGRITVATSMAGRGTDICLADDVAELGGLHVIVAEHHDSPRQDQQLFGRCARQGQPGTCQLYVSIDDEILDAAYGEAQATIIRGNRLKRQAATLDNAQQRLEQRRRQNRMTALYQEKQRLRSLWEMGRDPLLDCV